MNQQHVTLCLLCLYVKWSMHANIYLKMHFKMCVWLVEDFFSNMSGEWCGWLWGVKSGRWVWEIDNSDIHWSRRKAPVNMFLTKQEDNDGIFCAFIVLRNDLIEIDIWMFLLEIYKYVCLNHMKLIWELAKADGAKGTSIFVYLVFMMYITLTNCLASQAIC